MRDINSNQELDERRWRDITKLIKVFSDSLKAYIKDLDKDNIPDKDASLIALQVLSILVGLQRGYSKIELDKLWSTAHNLSNKINVSKAEDKITTKLQTTSLPSSKSSYRN